MYAAVMSFGSGSSFDWTSMMKAELTAENRPACVPPNSVFNTDYRKKTTDEDKGCVQVLVVLFGVIAVKFSGFSAVYNEEVGPRVIGPQRVKELFEDGTDAVVGYQRRSGWMVMNGLCVPLWVYLDDPLWLWPFLYGALMRG